MATEDEISMGVEFERHQAYSMQAAEIYGQDFQGLDTLSLSMALDKLIAADVGGEPD